MVGGAVTAFRRAERKDNVSFGWDSLSPAEREVTQLVASGLTNREIAAGRPVGDVCFHRGRQALSHLIPARCQQPVGAINRGGENHQVARPVGERICRTQRRPVQTGKAPHRTR